MSLAEPTPCSALYRTGRVTGHVEGRLVVDVSVAVLSGQLAYHISASGVRCDIIFAIFIVDSDLAGDGFSVGTHSSGNIGDSSIGVFISRNEIRLYAIFGATHSTNCANR